MCKQQYVEKRIVPDETIPDKLFVCFADVDPDTAWKLNAIFKTGKECPNSLTELHNAHLLYLHGLEKSGQIWEAGPSADYSKILYLFNAGHGIRQAGNGRRSIP